MMKTHGLLLITTLFLAFSSLVLGQTSFAPDDDMVGRPTSDASLDAPSRKSGSVFRRPAKESPVEQWTHAKALESNGQLRRAASQYNALVHRWHQSEEAPQAQFAYARLLYERGRYERAFREFQYLVEFFPGDFEYDELLDYQLRIANHVMNRRRLTFGVFRGVESPERALPMLKTLINNAPTWHKTPELRLRVAMIHETSNDHLKAVEAFESVMQAHPMRPEAQTAAFRKALVLADLSDRYPRDERRLRQALSGLSSFVTSNPGHPERATAQERMEPLRSRLEDMVYERARYYDVIEKRHRSALIAYRDFVRNFPNAERLPEVRRRISELEQLVEDSE